MSHPPFPRAEKVGVAQIRISKAQHSIAVLGSFVAADRLLKAWAAARDCQECEFEIRYLDGYRLCGRYPMRHRHTTRQSLGAHVRRQLTAAGNTLDHFLDHYEVEDFGEP